MTIIEEPLFLKDTKYYYYDETDGIFKLTAEGLKDEEILKSYEEFYKIFEMEEATYETD